MASQRLVTMASTLARAVLIAAGIATASGFSIAGVFKPPAQLSLLIPAPGISIWNEEGPWLSTLGFQGAGAGSGGRGAALSAVARDMYVTVGLLGHWRGRSPNPPGGPPARGRSWQYWRPGHTL